MKNYVVVPSPPPLPNKNFVLQLLFSRVTWIFMIPMHVLIQEHAILNYCMYIMARKTKERESHDFYYIILRRLSICCLYILLI